MPGFHGKGPLPGKALGSERPAARVEVERQAPAGGRCIVPKCGKEFMEVEIGGFEAQSEIPPGTIRRKLAKGGVDPSASGERLHVGKG